jgi:two-component system response regulator WspF
MRIAIANDMVLAVESLRRILQGSGQHRIAWIARDGAEAVRRCAEDRPDLILMDLIMPAMNGAEATRRIMSATPCPILVVTGSVGGNADMVFEAMGAGALDAVRTPILAQLGEQGAAGLLNKIATIEKLTRPATVKHGLLQGGGPGPGRGADSALVAIGSSTGGPRALATILGELPADFPAAIVIIQHVDSQFAGELAAWLNDQSRLKVRLACSGDFPRPGTALIAGTNDHLILDPLHCLSYSEEPREIVYRPSVDVFFGSVAAHWSGEVVGVLLTGMGRDGGLGLLKLREKGFHTIAEHASTCAVYGMPKAAVQLNAAAEVLPVQDIAAALVKNLGCGAVNPRRQGSLP